VVFGGFAVLAVWAAAQDPGVSVVSAAIPAILAAGAGLWALRRLLDPSRTGEPGDPGRRAVLRGVGALAGLAVSSVTAGRVLLERAERGSSRRDEVVVAA